MAVTLNPTSHPIFRPNQPPRAAPGSLDSHTVSYKENSLCLKLLAAIPFIGIIPSILCEASIRNRFIQSLESITQDDWVNRIGPGVNSTAAGRQKFEKIADIVETRNHYKYANIAALFLINAGIVALVALGIISSTGIVVLPLIGFALLNLGTIGINSFCIHKNNQLIEQLRSGIGIPRRIRVL